MWYRGRGKQRNMQQPGKLVAKPKFDMNLAEYEQGVILLGASGTVFVVVVVVVVVINIIIVIIIIILIIHIPYFIAV
jgi:hypothetical protein